MRGRMKRCGGLSMKPFLNASRVRAFCFVLAAGCCAHGGSAQPLDSQKPSVPIVLTGADRRPALSLNGEGGSIVDPYFSGLFSFHHEEKANGWFLNRKSAPVDRVPTAYHS